SGTPVTVTLGVTTPGIDFALTQKGAISGRVTDQATGVPVFKDAILFDGAGNYLTASNGSPNGTFTFSGLTPGTYFVKTADWSGPSGFVDELYNDIPCDGGCVITSGTPIVVTDGATTTGIDFALQRHGRITGRVTDAQLGLPLPNHYVELYDSSGAFVSNAGLDAAGNYSTWYLPAGTYYVLTQSYLDGDPWVDQLWQGHEC
ncbi:MAG: carboxypeptidase regulatory-like domain-containing protein, partial [Acidobacteria bacterium]|nr:carboxypeptidase regulatory-like domain-containing protein [Acidobacteriota bacterium]